MSAFRLLDGGESCEVTLDGRTVTLKAQEGYVYTDADRERVIATVERYVAGHAETTDERIMVRRWFGRQWMVRVDHSPPAWTWPKVLVNRRERWIGAGWRLTLVQVYLPKRAGS